MRAITVAGLVAAASVLSSAPATAAPPESAAATFMVTGCPFPVQVTLTGKSKVISHADRLITTAPAERATLTNTTTGSSVSVNLGGAFHEQVLPDGALLGKATGHNVFSGATVGGVIYTTGSVSYRVDATSGAVTITSPGASTVNLCSELA